MTGLKSGSGDDLWSNDEADNTNDSIEEGNQSSSPDVRSGTPDVDAERDDETGRRTIDVEQTAGDSDPTDHAHSYIVRRAVQDKSVQFERDERLTFFVHDDVAEGERELLTDLESKLGRDVPKFDVREAVYRAALRHSEDVLDELLAMGYTVEEE